MNPTDPLAALEPLREPAAIGWWPPAPGWWLLAVLALSLCVVAAYRLWRRHRINAYRRQALRQLQILFQRPRNPDELGPLVAELNTLLKRVALAAYPAERVAGRSGSDWLEFLNSTAPDGPEFPDAFADAAYRSEPTELDTEALQRSAAAWIRQHRRDA